MGTQGSNTGTQQTAGTNTGTQGVAGTNTGTVGTSGSNTGTVTDADTGSDTSTRNYKLTRKGNIGVTTTQQMLESERDLWLWNYFYEVVFPSVDKLLTIPAYGSGAETVTGFQPSGTILITQNGEVNVYNYETANVQVPNSYTEADEGKVVYNGALTTQGAMTISAEGTYNTTLIDSVVVAVTSGRVNLTDLQVYDVTRYAEAQIVDANLISANIKKDVNILGITGAFDVPPRVLAGYTEPSASLGNNGEVYVRYLETASGSMVSNNQVLDLDLNNYTYRTSDKIVLDYKNAGAHLPTASGVFGALLGTNVSNNAQLYLQYNTFGGRKCLNVAHAGVWGGDGNYTFNAPDNTEKYYRVNCDGNVITMLSGSELGIYGSQEFTTTLGTTSDTDTTSIKLLPSNNGNALNVEIFSLKVFRNNVLIHEYKPVEGGIKDMVDNVIFQITNPNVIFNLHSAGEVYESYAKVNGIWQPLLGTNISDLNIVS